MGKVKDAWMDWQDSVATADQLMLPVEEQLRLMFEYAMSKMENVFGVRCEEPQERE